MKESQNHDLGWNGGPPPKVSWSNSLLNKGLSRYVDHVQLSLEHLQWKDLTTPPGFNHTHGNFFFLKLNQNCSSSSLCSLPPIPPLRTFKKCLTQSSLYLLITINLNWKCFSNNQVFLHPTFYKISYHSTGFQNNSIHKWWNTSCSSTLLDNYLIIFCCIQHFITGTAKYTGLTN